MFGSARCPSQQREQLQQHQHQHRQQQQQQQDQQQQSQQQQAQQQAQQHDHLQHAGAQATTSAAPATSDAPAALQMLESEYFDLNVLKGAVSFNTKPFKHRALVWIGFKKVLFFPFCCKWWLSRISWLRFLVGSALYVLHNACAWLYVRGCLPQPRARPPLASGGLNLDDDNHVSHVEILLPYVIGAVFAIGYGSVVAAGGWEALRVPADGTAISEGIGSSSSGSGSDGGVGSARGGGGARGPGGGARGPGGGRRGGGEGGRGRLTEKTGDISFAAQVCARDSRAEEEANSSIDLDDDEDEDLDFSGPGSDNDDIDGVGQHCGGTTAAAAAAAAGAGATGVRGPTRTVTRSQTRSGANGSSARTSNGDGGVGAAAGGIGGGGGGSGSGSTSPLVLRAGNGRRPGRAAAPNGLLVRVLADGEERDGVGGEEEEEGNAGGVDDDDDDDDDQGLPGRLGPLSLAHKYPSFDTEGEEEDDEDEDDGGWGQVVVKPVKVARWDKQGQRSKHLLSLNQLRALIIARAESTPQKVIYRRAARLGVFATVCLPALFTVCTMVAYAWVNAGTPCTAADAAGDGQAAYEEAAAASLLGSAVGSAGGSSGSDSGSGGGGGGGVLERCVFDAGGAEGCGRIELEALAVEVLWRAARALWALLLRAVGPEPGDGASAAVSAISLGSVAFVALPTFRALEEAEQTYQRRYMYSKFFCALTSSQRARKHRLPYFSLKNVANIRVWLALRAGKTWLRRHRRERRADAVVSSAFFLSLALLAAILSEAISREARFLSTVVHWELLVWCCFISFFLLRYLTLGSNTNNRYRDTSVLLTEQINVQLRILQNSTNREASNKARKRERLGVSSNVLKLATKLLKELDGPNKLSGLSMNPVLYNVTRVVLVSALSGVMSDTLGFSVKLWKVISFK